MPFLLMSASGALAAWWLSCVSILYGAVLTAPGAKKK